MHHRQQLVVHLAQARGVEQLAAGAGVLDQQAKVVARVRVEAVRRVGRRGAAQGERGEAQVGAGLDHEAAFQLDAVPLQAAVPVAEHVEQREAGGQVLVDHVGAPHLVRAAFAQAEQAGGVVDLAVQQDDGVDAGVAQGTGRLHRRKGLELGADIGRGIAQHPVHAVVGQGDGRLRAWRGTQGAVTQALAVVAVAVPLWKPATGGGTENLDVHGHSLCRNRSEKTKTPRQAEALNRKPGLAVGEVHGDFEADAQISVCRFGPHGITPSG